MRDDKITILKTELRELAQSLCDAEHLLEDSNRTNNVQPDPNKRDRELLAYKYLVQTGGTIPKKDAKVKRKV
jgi:hypothetical protein